MSQDRKRMKKVGRGRNEKERERKKGKESKQQRRAASLMKPSSLDVWSRGLAGWLGRRGPVLTRVAAGEVGNT